jgi:hypothetical protein
MRKFVPQAQSVIVDGPVQPLKGMVKVMNKRRRRKERQRARKYIAWAEKIETTDPDRAAQYRRLADFCTRMSKPPKSRARRRGSRLRTKPPQT